MKKQRKITEYIGLIVIVLVLLFPNMLVKAKNVEVSQQAVGVVGENIEILTTVDGWEYFSLDDGTIEINRYLGIQTNLVIPETIDGKAVTRIEQMAFRECSSLISIKIPDGITYIGAYAFEKCSNLKNINLPQGIKVIEDYTFSECSSLTSVDLPETVTRIGNYAFVECQSLTDIKLPQKVTYIGECAFSNCSSLKNINIPSEVKNIGKAAFVLCRKLENISIPDGVTSIGRETFDGCSNLKSIRIPNSVIQIAMDAFYGCNILTIQCMDNSFAYTYAQKNNIPFQIMNLTLTLNANGGSVSNTSKGIIYGKTYGELPTPARTGYTFAGWYTAGSGGNRIISSSVVTSVSNHTLYAHWTPKQYTVTYNANGGKVSGTSKSITYGSTYGTLPVPVRTGCTFTGWYTAKSGGAKVTSQSVVKNTADQILYAQWKANTYTVSYQANGGKVTKTSGKIVYGSTYGTLPVPTRAGYTFTGWYTAKSGGTKITAKSIMKTAKNHTLYAHWKVSPPAGVTLKAKLKSANAVTLSWKKVSGAKGYEVYRATSPKGTYKRCKVLTSGSKTTYTDQKLSGGKTYYYKVRAYKISASKKVYGSYSKIVKKLVRGRLSTPKLAKPKSFKIGEPMTLQWNRIKNADKIEVYYNKNGGIYQKIKTVSGKNSKTTVPTDKYDFTKGNIYRFRIRAYYKEDGVTVYSDYSNSWGIGRK